ncbi:hypothetical protein BRYFOR_05752 [Marvinbryantia formatexigens DSM 14469]|uniref:Uncharacterized protein n=1 Tax=Marvinbryantia formatexigens DSM 14469 TaxID=478749 RepID=C6LAV8_9FIRM|nr:hypothetical protein BRYFOR_05752 [Marvinbryantia formatexigens DSM 14469]
MSNPFRVGLIKAGAWLCSERMLIFKNEQVAFFLKFNLESGKKSRMPLEPALQGLFSFLLLYAVFARISTDIIENIKWK